MSSDLSISLLKKDDLRLSEKTDKSSKDISFSSISAPKRSSSSESQDGGKPKMFETASKILTSTHQNAWDFSSCLGRLLFMWLTEIHNRANKAFITFKDLYEIDPDFKSKNVLADFESLRNNPKYKKCDDWDLVNTVSKKFYWKGLICYILGYLVEWTIPNLATRYFAIYKNGLDHIYMLSLYILGIFLALLLRMVLLNNGFYNLRMCKGRYITLMKWRIYKRMTNLALAGADQFSEVRIVNMISNCTDNASNGLVILPDFVASVIFIGIGTFFVYSKLNNCNQVLGLMSGLLLIAVFLFWLFQLKSTKYREYMLEVIDEKSKIVRSLVRDITLVKTFQLEKFFYNKITNCHLVLNNIVKRFQYWGSFSNVITSFLPQAFGFIIFGYILYSKHDMQESKGFIILTVLSIMKLPINNIAEAFRKFPGYKASENRMKAIFLEESKQEKEIYLDENLPKGALEFKKAFFCYSLFHQTRENDNRSSTLDNFFLKEKSELQDISLQINPGEKVAFTGLSQPKVSMLVFSLLGELHIVGGSLKMNGVKSYQSRKMFFLEDSVFQNIVVGHSYNAEKYQKVLELTGLRTIVTGSSGIENTMLTNDARSLPRDVRKLIILARMLYIESDFLIVDYFFDDLPLKFRKVALPLIFEQYKERTWIIATERKDIIQMVSKVGLMKGSTVGKFDKLSSFSSYALDFLEISETITSKVDNLPPAVPSFAIQAKALEEQSLESYSRKINQIQQYYKKKALYYQVDDSSKSKKSNIKRMAIMLRMFIFNSGYFNPALVFLIMTIYHCVAYFFAFFVSLWQSEEGEKNEVIENDNFRLYIIFSGVLFGCSVLNGYLVITYARKVSLKLYIYCIKGLLNHSLEWYHQKSFQEIVSSFVLEFSNMDEGLGPAVSSFIDNLIKFHIIIIICCFKTYLTGIPIIILYIIMMRAIIRLTPLARNAKILQWFSQSFFVDTIYNSFKGLSYFRNAEQTFYQDERFHMISENFENTRGGHQGNALDRWLSMRLYFCSLLIPILLMVNALVADYFGFKWAQMDSLEGFKLTISFDLVFTIRGLVESHISQALMGTSLEKLKEVMKKDAIAEKRAILSGEFGKIKLKQNSKGALKDKKSDSDDLFVISNLTFVEPITLAPKLCEITLNIRRKGKIAITGRNGSGRSTLLNVINRTVDPELIVSGFVKYNNSKIVNMTDQKLYSRLMKLGREYRVYSGKLRDNIDPKHNFEDLHIALVLEYLGYWRLNDLQKKGETFGRSSNSCDINLRQSDSNISTNSKSSKNSKSKRDSVKTIDFEQVRKTYEVSIGEAPSFDKRHNPIDKVDLKTIEKILKESQNERQNEQDKGTFSRNNHSKSFIRSTTSDVFDIIKFSNSDSFGSMDESTLSFAMAPAVEQEDLGLNLEGCSEDSLSDSEEDNADEFDTNVFRNSLIGREARSNKAARVTKEVRTIRSISIKSSLAEFVTKCGKSIKERLEGQTKELNRELSEIEVNSMTTSQKKLIQLSKMLLMKPSLIILDSEFMTDCPEMNDFIYSVIFKNQRDAAVVVVLDDLEELWRFERVYMLHKGRVVVHGQTSKLLSEKKPRAQGSILERNETENEDETNPLEDLIEEKYGEELKEGILRRLREKLEKKENDKKSTE